MEAYSRGVAEDALASEGRNRVLSPSAFRLAFELEVDRFLMKNLSSSRMVLAYPFALALFLVSASYLPKTWSQNPGATGGWSGSANYAAAGVVVTGPSHSAASQTHLMSSATLSNGSQQIVLVDPSRLTIAVYHVEPDKGDIQLKSVRKVDADFALEEFNLGEPSPSTIRKNLRLGER